MSLKKEFIFEVHPEKQIIAFDFEFTGLHKNTTPISLGMTTRNEEGFLYTFYAEFNDYDKSQVDNWLQNNVIDHLQFAKTSYYAPTYSYKIDADKPKDSHVFYELKGSAIDVFSGAAQWLTAVADLKKGVYMLGDCLAWDWVLFNDIMSEYKDGYPCLLEGVNYIPLDLATMFMCLGIDPDESREGFIERYKNDSKVWLNLETTFKHRSDWDSRVIYQIYELLSVY